MRANRRVEIGSTWYAQRVQRTPLNTEAQAAAAGPRLRDARCIAVEFRTHRLNTQSRRAIERLGAQLDGMLRAHQISPNGTLRDTAVYSITAAEWPTVQGPPATPARPAALSLRWRAPAPCQHGQEEEPERRDPVADRARRARPAWRPTARRRCARSAATRWRTTRSSSFAVAAVHAGRRSTRADAVRRQGRPAALVAQAAT